MNETGDKEFKGMRMEAIWQLLEATVIPIMTYGSEGWEINKKELEDLQTIFNKVLKTILFLPQGTPTTVLLAETGFKTIKHIINRKRIMQAHRIKNKKGQPLIKRITETEKSIWKNETKKIMGVYKIEEEHLYLTKNSLKKRVDEEIEILTKKEVEEEATRKSKVKHWMENRDPESNKKRPPYMEKLARKECNAIFKVRSRMIPVKANQKEGNANTICRFCNIQEETQEHVLKICKGITNKLPPEIEITDIFDNSEDQLEKLRKAAKCIIEIVEQLEKHQK